MTSWDPVLYLPAVTGLVFLAAWVALYFLPAILGSKKRNAGAIFVVNLLLGWTIVGWIACLLWAATADALPSTTALVQHAGFCSHCQSGPPPSDP